MTSTAISRFRPRFGEEQEGDQQKQQIVETVYFMCRLELCSDLNGRFVFALLSWIDKYRKFGIEILEEFEGASNLLVRWLR